jgi:hypothetical protein
VFSPIGLTKSLSWARIASNRRFPILCSLPLIAHQLASARDFFPICGRVHSPGGGFREGAAKAHQPSPAAGQVSEDRVLELCSPRVHERIL